MLEQLITYQDSRMDGFFSDKTILILHGDAIDYYSQTGAKMIIHVEQLTSKLNIQQKIMQMLNKHNKHTDTSMFFTEMIENEDYIVKMNKINSCSWSNTVQQTSTGYKVFSLDRLASVEIMKCLMLVKINYLQIVKDKSLIKKVKKEENFTKNILSKYSLEYQQYPEQPKSITVAYNYMKQQKVFLITKIHERWHYPVSQIWNYLISHGKVQKPVIEPIIGNFTNSTNFPTPLFLEQAQYSALPITNVPVFRFPQHKTPISLMMSFNDGQKIAWIGEQQAICSDGKGYWISHYQSLHLKFINSIDSQKIYNVNALPLVIRANGYESRIKDFLMAISNASFHRPLIPFQQKLAPIESVTSQQVVQINRIYSQFGTFTVFSNHTVTAKFCDNIFIVANYLKNTARIRDFQGKSLDINTNDQFYAQYLKHLYQAYECTYYPQQYNQKHRLIQQSNAMLNYNKQIIDHIDSGDYTRCTYSQATSQDLDVNQIMRKNQQMLKRLNKIL